MSTCDQADLTASFLLTSVLRTPMYCPKTTSAISARMITTIRPLPIVLSSKRKSANQRSRSASRGIQHSIHSTRHLFNCDDVLRGNLLSAKLLPLGAMLADIEQPLNR